MKNIKIISKLCSQYPSKLLKLSNSPDILFALGNISLLNTFSLAIIGSRNFTLDAKNITEKLVKDLVNLNITIISGMARGIDTIAHNACIKSGGKTIAILGCGFSIVEYQNIFQEILQNDGLIISEYLPDTPAFKYNFPRRNEIIAGISDGIIVTQAREKSGTLITAKHALKQNKLLFTIPWNIDNEIYKGNNILLTQGAKCILSHEDVIKNYPNLKTSSNNFSFSNIPTEYKSIYASLSSIPMHINQLSHKTKIPLKELQYKLTLMEIDNLVLKCPNNSWSKK